MVLAAGLGTRLRPLTENRPKALVELGGRTLLEIALSRLRDFGIREVIVNVHHFPKAIADYLKSKNNFGMRIEISHENILLDTGGGLKKAAWFFLENGAKNDEPFLLHNVDVISRIDFQSMVQAHAKNRALATLAVQDRETSRYLLFDPQLQLCGRRAGRDGKPVVVRPSAELQPLAFCGIHVISTRLLQMVEQDGVFSIIDTYLSLAGRGEKILAFRADAFSWRDLGKLEDLQQAERELKTGPFAQ
jgi:NDP-sugar pyrophosphorylase family protein